MGCYVNRSKGHFYGITRNCAILEGGTKTNGRPFKTLKVKQDISICGAAVCTTLNGAELQNKIHNVTQVDKFSQH